MNKFLLALLGASLLLSGCKTDAPAATTSATLLPDARPALWKLADKDTTIYLFGTIHALPAGQKWRTRAFDKALKSSQELVLEVADLDDSAKMLSTFQARALSPDLPPLAERLPADKRAELTQLIDKSGVPAPVFDRFETWGAAVTLASGLLRDLDVSPEHGVERALTRDFRASKRPIAGLETVDEQFSYFDGLSEPAQRSLLLSMVSEQAQIRSVFDKMLRAWATGNDAEIAANFDDELKASPELSEALLHRRNALWSAWIAKRLETPGTILVAVGAGHLAGSDSVQSMLAAKGFKLKRVQ